MESYGRYLPRDPTRLEAAKQLSLAAYLALFFHEISHVELCHLDFLRGHLDAVEYREIPGVPTTESTAAVLRALELEADMAALYRSLSVWRVMYPLFDTAALAPLTPEESWFLAVELLFWIMDFVQPQSRVGLLSTHPSPMARRENVQQVTSAVDWVPTMDHASPLVSWIVRNTFPSRALADSVYGSPERVNRELHETGYQLEALLPALDAYRRLPNRGE